MEPQSLNHDMLASALSVSAEWAMYANAHPEAENAMNGSIGNMEDGWRGRPALRAYASPEDIPALPGTERLAQATKDLMSLDNNPQTWSEFTGRDTSQPHPSTRSHSRHSTLPRPASQPLSASSSKDPALSLRDKISIASSLTYPSVFNSLSPTSSSESSTRPGSSSATSPSISAYGSTTSPTGIFPSSEASLQVPQPHNQAPKHLTNAENHTMHPVPNVIQPQPSSSVTLLPDTRPNSSFDPRSIAPNITTDVTMSNPTEKDEKLISKRKRPARPTTDNNKSVKDTNVSTSSIAVLRSIAEAKHAPTSAPTTTTSVIAPSKPSLLSPSQKKANHIQSEQKRRANIRRGYEALCEVVPALREAIRGEEAVKEAENAEGETGGVSNEADTKKTRPKKKRKPNKRTEDSEAAQDIGSLRLDGRAGPRSENVVLAKTIDHIQVLLDERSRLLSRLQRAREMLRFGRQPQPDDQSKMDIQDSSASISGSSYNSSGSDSSASLPESTVISSEAPLWERIWYGGVGLYDDARSESEDDD